MTKIYILLSIFLISETVVAQTTQYEHKSSMMSTTILDYLIRATSSVRINATIGFLLGTGWFVGKQTEQTAVHYDAVGNNTVIEILVCFSDAVIYGPTDTIEARVYEAGHDSMPTTLLGWGRKAVSDVTPDFQLPSFTSFPITSGTANITGNFLVAVKYDNLFPGGSSDTIGILSNNPSTGDGKGERHTKLKRTPGYGNNWEVFSYAFIRRVDRRSIPA